MKVGSVKKRSFGFSSAESDDKRYQQEKTNFTHRNASWVSTVALSLKAVVAKKESSRKIWSFYNCK
jgi:phage head maturation protease